MNKLGLVHVELKDANEFVENLHRHHKQVTGHRFSIGASKGGVLVGVAIVGRPVAWAVDPRKVVEVTRLCTDGTPNACSFLYAAAARAAKHLGYSRIQTYILKSETGISLKAAGWTCDGQVRRDGRGWNNREDRTTDQPQEAKIRWGLDFLQSD